MQKQEGNKYDKILKENFESVLRPLFERYLGIQIIEFEKLDPKLQTTVETETDFMRIVGTEKGERFILHIEFQSHNEKGMIYRVKEYDGIIQRKYQLEIRHFVIYLGAKPMTMRTQLQEHEVFRGFDTLSIKDLNFDEFLASQIPEEIIFAILADFKGEQPEQVIRSIIEKVKRVSPDPAALKKYIAQLQMLSQLRKLDDETIKITDNMPVIIDITQNAAYKRALKQDLEKAHIEFEQTRIKFEQTRTEFENKTKSAVINMLKRGMSVSDITEIMDVDIDYVIKIKNELDEEDKSHNE